MRKGNKDGMLTYKQLSDEVKRLRKENAKLRNELYGRKERGKRSEIIVGEMSDDEKNKVIATVNEILKTEYPKLTEINLMPDGSMTPTYSWPSTPEEFAEALGEWDRLIERIKNGEIPLAIGIPYESEE